MTRAVRPHIEATPVGKALCLFQPETGTLALLNGAASEEFAKTGQDWPGLGLLTSPLAPMRALPQQAAASDGAPALVMVLSSPAGGRLRLVCHEPWLAELLAAVLAPMHADDLDKPATTLAVARLGKNHVYGIWRDGIAAGAVAGRGNVRRCVLIEVATALSAGRPIAAMVHGCSVGLNGKAILLAGRSGAGKSSLTAALVAEGAEYLGDDLVPLCADGRHILPFGMALSVKSGAWADVAHSFPQLQRQPVLAVGDMRVRYLPLALPSTCMPWAVDAIVFPSYEPDADFTLRDLSPEEAFALLVDAGTEFAGEPRTAKPLVRLAECTRAVHLTYGQTASALAAVLAIGKPQ